MGGSRYDLSARVARLGALLGVCTLAATFSAGAQPTTGSIVGRLVDTSTGEPIVDGVLVLREFTTREQRVVHTDAAGEFRLVDLPAAAYSLHATALGYVGREYGQRHPMESGVPIKLAVGENRADLVVPLPPSGTITGRVTTQDGQPLAYADVGALRPRIDGDRRLLVPMGRSQSNGTGEFRIAGLPRGTTTWPPSTLVTRGRKTPRGAVRPLRHSSPVCPTPPRPSGCSCRSEGHAPTSILRSWARQR